MLKKDKERPVPRGGRVIHCNPVKFKNPPIPKKIKNDTTFNKCSACKKCKEETHENNCRKK